MTREELAERAKLLEGMTHNEWMKFSGGVSEAYEREQKDYLRNLPPPSPEKVLEAIRSRFG